MTQARTGFAAYATARTSALLEFARALTADDAAADELATEALARVHEAWPRLDDDPEPYAREVMVRSFLGVGRTRRLAADGVPRRDRAAWALVEVAGLSLGEAAGVLDTSPTAVQRAVQRVEARTPERRAPQRVGEPSPTATTPRLDLDRVARRVDRERRRHRVASAVVALAANTLVALVGRALVTGQDVLPGPTPSAGTFAEFAEGGRLAGQAAVPLTIGNTALDALPSSGQIGIGVSCDTDAALNAQLTVNERQVASVACTRAPTVLPGISVDPGRSVRIGVQALAENGTLPTVAGALHLAWYKPVPWDAYPLPPRPAKVPPLPLPDPNPTAVYLAVADGRADGNQVSRSFEIPAVIQVKASTVAPGRITVRINGVQVATVTSWDYQPHRYETRPIDVGAFLFSNAGVVPGGQATLQVTATDFTDPQWYVVVEPGQVTGSTG